MTESRAIELHVRLPSTLADEIERVRDSDPEVMNRIVAYGVTRRVIFDHLLERGWLRDAGGDARY